MKAIIFSGQGSQKTGIGQEFYQNFKICREVFDEASQVLGYDMAALCFEKESADKLELTEYAQPAILTASIATYKLLYSQGVRPSLAMGLSLGEYTALCASDSVSFTTAVSLVAKRGRIMTEYAAKGGMFACIGIDIVQLKEVISQAQSYGFAALANHNTPNQIVIACDKGALDFCKARIKELKGKVIPLKVAGPFHTKLYDTAAMHFENELKATTFKTLSYPVISNLTADFFDVKNAASALKQHMVSPVLWVDSVKKAINFGVDTFIEIGGDVLIKFVKDIDKAVKVMTVNNIESLEKAKTEGYFGG